MREFDGLCKNKTSNNRELVFTLSWEKIASEATSMYVLHFPVGDRYTSFGGNESPASIKAVVDYFKFISNSKLANEVNHAYF